MATQTNNWDKIIYNTAKDNGSPFLKNAHASANI